MTPTTELPIDEDSGVEERPQNRREWGGFLRSLVLPLVIVGTIVGGLFYIEQRRDSGAGTPDGLGVVTLPPELNTTGRAASSEIGRAAPDFVLETPDGGRLRLSDLRGHPVLVNFWATWCTDCRQEMPQIVNAYDAHAGAGTSFMVVGVDLQENAGEINDFASEFGMKFPIGIDRNGGVASAWHIGGPIQGIPSSYFIDKDGIVQARTYGPLTADTIAQQLAKIGVGS